MVNSRFEYVKEFEREEKLLYDTYIVVEIHGTGFKSFCVKQSLIEPDDRITRLMAAAARHTMETFADIEVAFGYRDNFYLVFNRSTKEFNRRRDKILSDVVSLFVSSFVYKWSDFFDSDLTDPPDFRGKITLFPRAETVKQFLITQQLKAASCCISLYVNIVASRANEKIPDNMSFTDQNEYLFKHGINYNSLPAWHKRGKILFREKKIYESSDDLSSVKPDFWKKHKLLKD